MTEQHISFTSDEEMDESHFITYGFSSILSPLSSPKRNQSMHGKDDNHDIPVDGACFSSLSFDWSVGIAEEAQPAAADFSLQRSANRSKDVQSLLPSNYRTSCSRDASSWPWEAQQPLAMQRNYPSLYAARPSLTAAKAPCDFLSAVQQFTCSTTTMSNNNAHLPCSNGTATDPPLKTPENDPAEFYSEILQAAAGRVVEQQQLSACVPDVAPSDTEVVDFSSIDVSPPAPPRSNIACGPPEFELFYDQQTDKEVQIIESGSQLKDDVPHSEPDVITSCVESNLEQDLLQDQDNHPTRLSIPTDQQFLDPVHSFLRSSCVEVFVCGIEEEVLSASGGRGRGPKPHKEGQIGLRCAYCKDVPKRRRANQAVSYPSKTAHIFESVRNYQRIHLEACECIPMELKMKHRELVSKKPSRKVHLKYIKVYFAEAACEIGVVETANGLFFGAPPNTSGKPSEKLQAIMSIAENPSSSEHRKMKDLLFPKVDERVENSKFSHIASIQTRNVIAICRQEKTAFVYPSDFPTLSDFRFVLYHQFVSCRPPTTSLNRRKTKPEKWDTLSGLCCKHCAKAYPGARYHEGMYFPLDLESLHDSSFFTNLTCHIMTCPLVPLETKEALDELQLLAAEHGVVTKRGAKRFFLKKLWDRLANYYPAP